MPVIHVDVRILHKRFPGKYDHIQSGRVPVTAADLGISPQGMFHHPSGAAGTELKKLLSFLGIKPVKGCKCKKRARYMDKMGCDWCEQNVGQIIGWLQEEHTRTKSLLPFISFAAEKLVRLAIRRARQGNSQ